MQGTRHLGTHATWPSHRAGATEHLPRGGGDPQRTARAPTWGGGSDVTGQGDADARALAGAGAPAPKKTGGLRESSAQCTEAGVGGSTEESSPATAASPTPTPACASASAPALAVSEPLAAAMQRRPAAAALVLAAAALFAAPPPAAEARECRPEDVSFELTTGFVQSSAGQIIATRTGVLRLAECIAACRRDTACEGVNFETGLCVLFAGDGAGGGENGLLTKSQFPVFALFARKVCARAAAGRCARAWAFEVVRGHELRTYVRHRRRVGSRRECMELCLQEREFSCRSGNYNHDTGDCALSDMDRFTVSGLNSLVPEKYVDYIESNCVNDPVKMCDFSAVKGKILKTVDAVYENINTIEECRQLCIQSKEFRCHSFDYGDAGSKVCRLSHHSVSSLQHIEEPYLDLDSATTHQLTSCYNVTINCRASDMVARVQTNKVFNGKVYAKNRPNSCVADVVNSLEFDLRLGYHDLNCDVKQDAHGRYSTEIIIQHHDQIVTSQDVGLSIRCSFNMQNRSIGHGVELQVGGDLGPAESEESAFVSSPTVTMRITNRKGEDIHTALVGDALSLRFDIQDKNTPYQIFVRELIALDGVDSSEILLIDSLGCPTDPTIMGAISVVDDAEGAKTLQAPFDAFKFPTSDVVQFKALVTPCLPKCEPVVCDVEDYYGMVRQVNSYGKRRRRDTSSEDEASENQDEMLVVQSIRIADKFQFDKTTKQNAKEWSEVTSQQDSNNPCLSGLSLAIATTVFLVAQLFLIVIWVLLYQKKWKKNSEETKSFPPDGQSPWHRLESTVQ